MLLVSFTNLLSYSCCYYAYCSTKTTEVIAKQQTKSKDLVLQPSYFPKPITCCKWVLSFASYIMNVKFSKQIDKVNQLLNSIREEPSIAIETVSPANTSSPRPKASSKISCPGSKPKY